MVLRRVGKRSINFFVNGQKDLFHLYDIIAKTYGCLPSEIAKLKWEDLYVCIQAVKSRSERVQKILSRSKRKKDMIFPTISVFDMVDIL